MTVPIEGEWIGERKNGAAHAGGHAALCEFDDGEAAASRAWMRCSPIRLISGTSSTAS